MLKKGAALATRAGLILLLGFLLRSPAWAEHWKLLGPDGGDARSLAYDPHNPDHVFLGTSTGSVFISTDGGQTWSYSVHLGSGDDYALDHIVIDPRNPAVIFVSAWNVRDHKSGEIFRSRDGGNTWLALPGMHEKSTRSLAMAVSNPNVLAAGALDGVYLSEDSGESWRLISAADRPELKNIESIAIDPKDPNVIYAGTWHLAWKTADSGRTWRPINRGMIDDSDVFSIIVDPLNPSVVYTSACSGIYKSDSGGEIFRKIQGIPFSARRTRILRQDPNHTNIIYAGTTEGLWKTTDAGKRWVRMTEPSIVINDVLVDPRHSGRLLLATDRRGVMASENGGLSFSPSNRGYIHRYVTSILADMNDPSRLFVGVANDREWGGVFSLRDGGRWQQTSAGLGGRDVLALSQAADGTLIAGTNRGIFILDRWRTWRPGSEIRMAKSRIAQIALTEHRGEPPAAGDLLMNSRINEIHVTAEQWWVATSIGLFLSLDQGRTWTGGPVLRRKDFVSVQTAGRLLVAATQTEVLVSSDAGLNWQVARFPVQVTSIRGLAVTPHGELLVAAREGAFRSSDLGKSWEHVSNGLPENDISSIDYDDAAETLLASSLSSGVIFESRDGGRSWQRGPDAGYPLRKIAVANRKFVAATSFDGVVAEP